MNSFNDFPEAEDYAMRAIAPRISYEKFIEKLYIDIDCIFSLMMDGVGHLLDLDETGISFVIWMNLRSKNYDAQLDSDKNGNADISVTYKNYKWIAESKIYGDKYTDPLGHLYQGFLQLTTRYSKCEANADCGGLFIFIKPRGRKETEKSIMDSWLNKLNSKRNELSNLILTAHSANDRSLYSEHDHMVSGYRYKVRHMPLCLLHLPEDKSGLDAKKYKAARVAYNSFEAKN
jgi:hypothetical protein